MIILAIETSTTEGSVALLRDGECLLATTFTSERSHNSQIFGPLGEALDIAKPDLIAVGTGPGSYTGARIGIAAGIGISLSHNAQLIGIPSVQAAELADTYQLFGDARRGKFFYAQVENRQLLSAPELIDHEQLEILAAAGNALTFDTKPPAQGIQITRPSAEILAGIAAALPSEKIESLANTPVVPHYMSAPFITPPKRKPGQR